MALGKRKRMTEGRGILAERRAIRRKASSTATKTRTVTTAKRRRKKTKKTVKRERASRASSISVAFSSSSSSSLISAPATTKQENTPTTAEIQLQPKVEYSPNALAKCHVCRKKIRKEHKRYGIPEHSERYNKEIYRYYHYNCCPAQFKAMVPNAVADLQHQKDQAAARQVILEKRKSLVQKLQDLRTAFANRLQVSPFIVFSNHTLEEIVYHMPTSSPELLDVHGIGAVKLKSFGDPILHVVQQYERTLMGGASSKRRKPTVAATINSVRQRRIKQDRIPKSTTSAMAAVIVIDVSDDEDNEINMGETLTCEELVNQKFQHAAANGYVISVD